MMSDVQQKSLTKYRSGRKRKKFRNRRARSRFAWGSSFISMMTEEELLERALSEVLLAH
jgi:hypothetical protein